MRVYKFNNSQGFTIIEIIIAITISLILSLGVISLFTYTKRLNDVATQKLRRQQDISLLTNMISRDAAMAGSFGCLSLGLINGADSINNDNKFNELFHIQYNSEFPPIIIDRPNSKFAIFNNIKPEFETFGVLSINSANLPRTQGLKYKGNALIFSYGTGSTGIKEIKNNELNKLLSVDFNDGDPNKDVTAVNQAGGYLALASCQALNIFKGNKTKYLKFTTNNFGDVDILTGKVVRSSTDTEDNNKVNHQLYNEMNLLKYNLVTYVVAEDTQKNLNLYKISLANDGTWSDVIVVLNNVSDMKTDFVYATDFNQQQIPIGCPTAFRFSTGGEIDVRNFNKYSLVSFEKSKYKLNNNKSIAPALINIQLSLLNDNYKNRSKNDKTGENNKTIKISAVIRGGNSCTNRKATVF